MKSNLLLPILVQTFAFFIYLNTNAQTVSDFSFAASSGTYTAIGGTNPSGTGTVDEGYFNGISIGFTFKYLGTSYTTVSASTNGWATLGQNISDATYTNSLSSGGNRPVIAPLWDDLDLQTASNFSYTTTGSSPNRIFTMQWSNMQWNYQATGNTISFQVKLYETSNIIQFIYRNESGSYSSGSSGASVGLTASGTGSGNFLSLSSLGTTPTTSTSSETSNIATEPTSGQTYTFTPPSYTTTITAGAGAEPASLSSLVDTQGESVLSFDFVITDDAGSGGDSYDFKFTQLIINQGTGNDVSTWSDAIEGASLSDGTNTVTGTVNSTNITFSSLSTSTNAIGYVADNAAKTYTLKIWLKSTMGGSLATTIDGSNLVFLVQNSSFTLSSVSSYLAASQSQNSGSTNNAVAVVATNLIFSTQPTSTATINVALTTQPVVKAVDANGNLDLGFTETVTLSNSGGLTTTDNTEAAVSGIATFATGNDFTFTSGGQTVTLTASSASIPSGGTSNSIVVSIICSLFEEYFENAAVAVLSGTSSSGWYQTEVGSSSNDWKITNIATPITGTKCLTVFNGTSYQYTNSEVSDITAYYGTAIDARKYKNVNIDFKWKHDGDVSGDEAYVVWSTDLVTWQPFGSSLRDQATTQTVTDMDLSPVDGQQFYLGFRWVSDGDGAGVNPPFVVDDIVVSGTPVSDYNFSYRSDVFTSISGTVLSLDANEGADITLPSGMNFTYMGNSVTTVRANLNGWIEMGNAHTSNATGNDLTLISEAPFVAPLWDDMTSDGQTRMIYGTSGSTPTRVFTIEWRDLLWGGARQNFQVKLYETSNAIEFHYGTMNTPTGASASIGMNQVVGSCQNRLISVTPASSPTASYTTADNAVSATTYLSSGTVYVFYPSSLQTYQTWQAANIVVGQSSFTASSTTVNSSTAPGANSSAVSSRGVMAIGSYWKNRVMIWSSIPTANGTAANYVIGQADFTSSASATTQSGLNGVYNVAFSPDGSKLLVADAGNHRVLIYNLTNGLPTGNGQNANVVIGQSDFTTGTSGTSSTKLKSPKGILVLPNGKLIITDGGNHRVLIYNKIPTSNGAAADVVIGQSDFVTGTSGTSASKLNSPWDAAFTPEGKLLISDNGAQSSGNHRILIFNSVPTSNGASADLVIGNTVFAAKTSGTSRTELDQPSVTVSCEGKIAVADFGNSRIMMYNRTPTANGASADAVLGQPNFTTGVSFNNGYGVSGSASSRNMYLPYSINFDLNGRLLVNGSDASGNGMHRVMIYGTTPATSADVALAFTTSASGTICIGMPVSYTVTITNNGPSTASGIVVNASLPVGFTPTSSSTSTGSFNSSSGFWTIPALTNGVSATLTFTGTVGSSLGGTSVTAYANIIASGQNDTNFGNNAASVTLSITNKNAPVISAISDQFLNKNSNTTINFTVNDVEGYTGMTYTGTSSNTALQTTSNPNFVVSGSEPNKSLYLQPVSNAYGYSTMSIKVTDGDGCYVSEGFELAVGNIWEGDVSNAWATAGNWSSGGVPTSTVEAIIPEQPKGGYFPIITGAANCESLLIEGGASLTINNGGSLNVYGNITLESNSIKDASLVDLNTNNGLTMSGTGQTVTVQRYMTANQWHYFSAPVSAASSSLYRTQYEVIHYKESWTGTSFLSGWEYPFSGGAANLTVARGYGAFYYSNQTIGATGGVLNSGQYKYKVTNQDDAQTSTLMRGWNLVGNPYPSGLDATDFLTANSAVIDQTAYFWGKAGETGLATSDYASWNATTQLGTIGGTNVTPDKYISTGQAFFVHRTVTDVAGTDVTFTNSMRETENSYFYKKSEKDNPVTHFKLQVTNPNGELNEILITFVDGATTAAEPAYDGLKIRGNNKLALYTMIGSNDYCIQGLPPLSGATTVPVGLDATLTGNYKFYVSARQNFPAGTQIELVDLLTNTTVDLTQTTDYDFTLSSTGSFRNRFELRFNPTPKVTTWTGADNTDWHNDQNWNFGVPTSATDVIIQKTNNHPVVLAQAECKNLTIRPQAVVNMFNQQLLQVHGNLLVESGAQGTGALVLTDDNAVVDVTGTSEVQMYLGASGRYFYVSSPVQGAQSSVFGTTDELTNSDARLYRLNTTTDYWERVLDETQTVNTMQGYAFKTSQSTPRNVYTWTGALNNGAQSISLDNGFTLVGNPYPSAIDWNLIPQTSELSATMWYRVGGSGGNGGGGYFATYNRALRYGINGGQSYIPAMQAFWVEAPNGGTLQIDNTVRIAQSPSFYKQQNIKNGVALSLSGNGASDQMALCLHTQAVDAFDVFDSRKMEQNADAVTFYSFADNKKIAINALNNNVETSSVELGFVAPHEGSYTIKVDELTFDAEVQAFLEDRLLQTIVPLQASSVVEFTSQAGTYNNRFVLHLRRSATVVDNNTRNNINVYAFQKNIYVLSEQDALVEVYDITGKLLVNTKKQNNTTTVITIQHTGCYFVKTIDKNGTNVSKVMIE